MTRFPFTENSFLKSDGPSAFILPVSRAQMQQILEDHILHEDFIEIMKRAKGRVNLSIKYMKELQEKAEKWDELMNVGGDHFSVTDLMRENKQLKIDKEYFIKIIEERVNDIIIISNESKKNKEIVQKVRELIAIDFDSDCQYYQSQLNEILKEKS